MEIVETKKYGLANTIGGVIFLHPILQDFPELRQRIIHHEFEHQKAKGFLANRKVDALTDLKFSDLLPIYKKKPSLFFKQYSPISYIDKTLFFEWSLITLYLISLGFLGLIYWIIKTFSKDSFVFWKIIQYIVIISIIVLIVYFGGRWVIREINKQAKKLPEGKKDQLSNLKALSPE